MLAYGAGIGQGRSGEPVEPPQIAPTVAILLGVQASNGCEVAPLVEALNGAADHFDH